MTDKKTPQTFGVPVDVEVELGEDGDPEIVGAKNQVVVMVPGVEASFDETALGWDDSFRGSGGG